MSSPYDETHDIGRRLYWHTLRVPRSVPVLQLDGVTHEVEPPWRIGRCVVLRVLSFALAVGWWGPARSAEEMLEDERLELFNDVDDDELAHEAEVGVDSIREDFREQEPRSYDGESPYDVRTWQ